MRLFKKKKSYGRSGKLTRDEWKRLLNSNNGLFKRAKKAPKSVIGPTLTETGSLVGNMMAMEAVAFENVANGQQHKYYKELAKVNPKAAKEYLLTISGSINIWKKDIKWIRVVLHYLEKEEHVLKEEEKLITKEEKLKEFMHIPFMLKRHYPKFFEDVELEELKDLDFSGMLKKIIKIEEKTRKLEKQLKKDIKELKEEVPFLFE